MLKRLFQVMLVPWLARHPALVLALLALYVLSPFDLLPEAFTGVVGYVDDLILLIAGFTLREMLRRRRPGPAFPGGPPQDAVDTTAEVSKKDR